MERPSAKRDDIAASWLQRRESEGWNSALQAELHAWLDGSIANRVAFLRLEAAWEEAGRLHALAPGYPRRTVPSPDQLRLAPSSEAKSKLGRPKALAIAASLLLIAVGVVTWSVWPSGDRYATPVGGLTSVPLKDGSSISLNTASRIRVHLTETERRVELTEGEAYFEVAKDPKRPFTVTAGQKIITAVGTAFSVRKDDREVRVVVTEGQVKIEDGAKPSRAPTYIAAGGVVRSDQETLTVEERPLPQTEELMSWRTGYVVFRDTPLTEVVAEFNRYNDRPIVIADPQVAAIRLTGKFRATNTDALIRLLTKSFEVNARATEDHVALTGKFHPGH